MAQSISAMLFENPERPMWVAHLKNKDNEWISWPSKKDKVNGDSYFRKDWKESI